MNIEKFLSWIRQHWLLTIIASLIIPLLIIHILFKLNFGVDFFAAEWSAGDLLGYIAGAYTFIGTILLGVVTVEQSQRAQKVNEQLSKENNYLQKIAAQRLMPLVRIASVTVWTAQESRYLVKVLGGKVQVTESISLEQREIFINVILPNTKSERLQEKVILLSFENISDGIIRQIAIERVEFSGFSLCGEDVEPTVCYGDANAKFMSNLLLPHEKAEISVRIYYSDKRYTQFWELRDCDSVGEFDMCIYLKNTSISDIVCYEKIYIKKPEGLKEKIMYRTFEENLNNGE